MRGARVIFVVGLGAAVALWAFSRTRRGQAVQVGALDQLEEIRTTAQRLPERAARAGSGLLELVTVTAQRISETIKGALRWAPPAAAAPYLDALDRATQAYGLPPLLLARVAYQESRFRPDIITGAKKSSAGAEGIMQIVPRWHPDVDPLDPTAAIDYAAKYLRGLHDRFGSWSVALAAYNWGQGNQSKDLRDGIVGNEWPAETRAYVRDITADVGLA